MKTITITLKAEGRDGYVVAYSTPINPVPIALARFDSGSIGRREANMYKNGIIAGLRIAANYIEGSIST